MINSVLFRMQKQLDDLSLTFNIKLSLITMSQLYISDRSVEFGVFIEHLDFSQIPALASATVFLLLTDEQAPSLKLAEGRCRRQRPEAVSRP